MCGFLGVFGRKADTQWVVANVDNLRDRGPDHQSVQKVNKNFSVGAARLAMVDPLPRSNQPFSDGRFWLCFNGEIYNHEELRKELSEEYSFKTASDTEVLFALLSRFGISALTKLNGMYSFAFFDSRESKLLLGRDSLGKKPLYYCSTTDDFYFSSKRETLPVFNTKNFRENRSDISLLHYLYLGFSIDPWTFSPKHFSLLPGEIIEVTLSEQVIKFHSLNTQNNTIKPHQKSYDRKTKVNLGLRESLTDAVSKRISNQKHIGLLLSGGMDSTIIAIILKDLGVRARTYSAFWPDSDKERYNLDFEKAKLISRELGHDFIPIPVFDSSLVPEKITQYLDIMQEPNNNPSGLSAIPIFERMKVDGTRLALTGDGGDELFGGYARYATFLRYRKLSLLKPGLQVLSSIGYELSRNAVRASSFDSFDDWAYWHSTFTLNDIERMGFSRDQIREFKYQNEQIASTQFSVWRKNSLKTLMYFDQILWLSMESNRRLDRVSMAFSIEARSPFQDDNIREMFLREEEKKIKKFIGKKQLLMAFPELSTHINSREKLGFVSPVGHWMRQNQGDVTKEIAILARRKEFRSFATIDINEALYSKHFKTLRKIWTLYVLAKWLSRDENIQ